MCVIREKLGKVTTHSHHLVTLCLDPAVVVVISVVAIVVVPLYSAVTAVIVVVVFLSCL